MFARAERKKSKLRLGLAGISGSGKTKSALLIASGISDKIALIDTERRGHLYAKEFVYDIAELDAPYSPQRYIERIKEAEKLGYEVLIIDSLSHAWSGEGGVLSIAEKAGGGFQTGWRMATPQQNLLIDTIITSKCHIILTLRSKSEYVVEPNEKGKMAPRKVGMTPIQREGLDYELTIFMEFVGDNVAHVAKDNTQLFTNQFIKPTQEMGEKLSTWLTEGKDIEEIMKNELISIEEKITTSSDLEQLKTTYNALITQYPNLKEKIVSFAKNTKMNLQKGEVA